MTRATHAAPGMQPEVRTVSAELSLDAADVMVLSSIADTGAPALLSADGRAVAVTLVLSSQPRVLSVCGLCLDWRWATLSYSCRSISLPPGELRMMAALLERAPAAVARSVLASRLWPRTHDEPETHYKALGVWICCLRRRLDAVRFPGAIESVRGIGYRLIAHDGTIEKG